MTPQDLINLPGAGNAEKQLRKMGKWDEAAVFDGVTEYKIKVAVKGWYEPEIETQYIEVIATNKREDIDKAAELCDFDEIEDTEIMEATRQCN